MTDVIDTYSPLSLEKYLGGLELKGLKIVKVESPSIVFQSKKIEKHDKFIQYALVDKDVIFSFNNDKKIGFDFSSASHVFIYLYESDYEMLDVWYEKGDPSISEIFSEIVGKTIADFKIESTKNIEDLGFIFEDEGFNEYQDEFITVFYLIFTDGSKVGFYCEADFTSFNYEKEK